MAIRRTNIGQDPGQPNLLDALPLENDPMSVSELDGFLTGVLACPEMIPPSDWLSQVWGATGDAKFPDLATAEATIGAVMIFYAVRTSLGASLRARAEASGGRLKAVISRAKASCPPKKCFITPDMP